MREVEPQFQRARGRPVHAGAGIANVLVLDVFVTTELLEAAGDAVANPTVAGDWTALGHIGGVETVRPHRKMGIALQLCRWALRNVVHGAANRAEIAIHQRRRSL